MPHGQVAMGSALQAKAYAVVEADGGAIFLPDAQGEGMPTGASLGDERVQQSGADAASTVLRQKLDIDQTNFVGRAPYPPRSGIPIFHLNDRVLGAGEAGGVVRFASVKLSAKKLLTLRGSPAGAGEFVGPGFGVKSQQKAQVGRRDRTQGEGRGIFGGRFHDERESARVGACIASRNTQSLERQLFSPTVRAAIHNHN